MSQPIASPVFVAGHRGMVGSAVVRALKKAGISDTLTATRSELDLTNQAATEKFFSEKKPASVIFAAAKVGGIHANSTYPADFIYENTMMAANAIHSAWKSKATRFLFLGSTCIYPRMAPQPMPESCLLTAPLEVTNEAYALAKITGLKMCQHYRAQHGVMFHSAMPTNLYGPSDNYHPENSHVLPALIRRFHEAKENGDASVTIWGTGTPRREFLHVDDLAAALLHLMQLAEPPEWVNVGTGSDVSIQELAQMVAEIVDFDGEIKNDTSKPDGTPVKRTDTTVINKTGWFPKIDLRDGIASTYQDFLRSWKGEGVRQA